MGGHWRKNQGQDRYFRQAKEEGYRPFRLRWNGIKFAVIRKGDRVLDLGAARGGRRFQWWAPGRVIAVDLEAMDPIPGVTIITGDMLAPEVQARLHGPPRARWMWCDAAPALGIRDRDHALHRAGRDGAGVGPRAAQARRPFRVKV